MKITRAMVIAVLALTMFSCKEEVDPTLIVTVYDTLGTPLNNARVYTHPCLDKVSCAGGVDRVNPAFIKTELTNAAGQVTFEYPYSAIIDVLAQWTDCDTPTTWCLSSAQTVARFETKKLKKDEKNEYNIQLTVYPEL